MKNLALLLSQTAVLPAFAAQSKATSTHGHMNSMGHYMSQQSRHAQSMGHKQSPFAPLGDDSNVEEFEIHFAPMPMMGMGGSHDSPSPHGGPRQGEEGMITMEDLLSIFPPIGAHGGPGGPHSGPGPLIIIEDDSGPPMPMPMMHHSTNGREHVSPPMAAHQTDHAVDKVMEEIIDDITAGFAKSILPAFKKLDQEKNGRPCHDDLLKHCSHSTKKLHCLGEHREDISPQCQAKIKRSVSFACHKEITATPCDSMDQGVLQCLEKAIASHRPHVSEACMDSVIATRAVTKTLNTHTSTIVHKDSGQAVHVHHPFNQWFHCSKLGESCECKNGFVRYGVPNHFSQVMRSKDNVKCLPDSFNGLSHVEGGKQDLIHGASCQCMLERFPTSNQWNVCGDEAQQCQCTGAVRFGDGLSWSQPIHSASSTLCMHHLFHFHPKTYEKAQHHCQCLPQHTIVQADADSHPNAKAIPNVVHIFFAVAVLIFIVAIVSGKVQQYIPSYSKVFLYRDAKEGCWGGGTEMNYCKNEDTDTFHSYGSSL